MSQFTNEVLGPVTDAELRATPVPISGTVTSTPSGTQDVNVTNGSLAVTGPLTDTQLRATAVPVTQGGTPTATVSRVAVSTTVATLQASNSSRKRLVIFNESGTLFLKLGTAATVTDYTYRLTANTTVEVDFYTGEVTGIKATGSTFAQITEIA